MNDIAPLLSKTAPLFSKNLILKSLTREEGERLQQHLTYVETPHGEILYRPDEPIEYAYFPTGAMISMVGYTPEGQAAEVGVIGPEGVFGVDVLLGGASSPYESMVQLPNGVFRIETEALRDEFNRCGSLHKSTLSFVRKLMTQFAQNAVCNRLHSLEERLARWLLMCDDRSQSENLKLTQEFLALMAGATRSSVTLTAISFREVGYISYTCGNIRIEDRPGLEGFACDCYQVVRRVYDSN